MNTTVKATGIRYYPTPLNLMYKMTVWNVKFLHPECYIIALQHPCEHFAVIIIATYKTVRFLQKSSAYHHNR